MNKTLFFDAGPIITLILCRLGWIIAPLKKQFNGTFYITPAVRYELIDRPLSTKRFELEALEVSKMVREGTLTLFNNVSKTKANEIQELANSAFTIKDKTLDVLQSGEVESITAALDTNSSVVMDERTLRLFIENNKEMKHLLESRNRYKVVANKEKMDKLSFQLKGVPIIRSIELVAVAYKLGLLTSYIPEGKGGKEKLLDALLWATKYNGCSVTEDEIEEMKALLLL